MCISSLMLAIDIARVFEYIPVPRSFPNLDLSMNEHTKLPHASARGSMYNCGEYVIQYSQ